MSISETKLNHLCQMSAFDPTDPRIAEIVPELEQKIAEITPLLAQDFTNIPPTAQPIPSNTVLRPDTITPQESTREDLLDLTPYTTDHQIKVPKVL